MTHQPSFSQAEFADKKKITRREKFLARLEEKEGNLSRAIQLLELAQKGSPHPEALQPQIDEFKQKLGAGH